MVTIKDGPAAGATLMIPRAPRLLRVVVKRATALQPVSADQTALFNPVSQTVQQTRWAQPKVDCLDQPDDVAEPDETICVYRRVSHGGRMHLNTGRRTGSGFYAVAEYEHVPGVDGEQVRTKEAWIRWATEHQHLSPPMGRVA